MKDKEVQVKVSQKYFSSYSHTWALKQNQLAKSSAKAIGSVLPQLVICTDCDI